MKIILHLWWGLNSQPAVYKASYLTTVLKGKLWWIKSDGEYHHLL